MLAADGAEKAIRKMMDQKAIRFRGFSCHSPELALDALGRIHLAVQFTINATRNPDFEAEVLRRCKSKGIAVMAMKICGHGFFMKEASFRRRRDESAMEPGGSQFDAPEVPRIREPGRRFDSRWRGSTRQGHGCGSGVVEALALPPGKEEDQNGGQEKRHAGDS